MSGGTFITTQGVEVEDTTAIEKYVDQKGGNSEIEKFVKERNDKYKD